MGYLYHGSSQTDLKRLEPHQSTHGNYVYATPYKELAIIFSARAGDDATYALYRMSSNEPWNIVERVPNGFGAMFSNSASLYTIEDSTFKNINTGFAEVVSEVGVDIKTEEKIENVYEKIKELEKLGVVKLYNYPNKPNEIPFDNSDLIDKQLKQLKRNNKPVRKEEFNRLVLLHPQLIGKVNELLIQNNINDIFSKEDLVSLFEYSVISQALRPNKEQYLKSSIVSISNLYPELLPVLEQKLSFLEKSKNEKIYYLIDKISDFDKTIPQEYINQVKEHYANDERTFTEIGTEISNFSRKIKMANELIRKPINDEILDNSILLIGPMGTGKSTISKQLNVETGMPKISLDDREQLSEFYKNRNMFENFKEFEFYLTSSVLTSLTEPSIIDFGAGHSVYENPIMFNKMKQLISRFKNVELILPSENLEESLQIINERMSSRNGTGPHNDFESNKHFLQSPCNYELTTNIIYTKNMLPDEISKNIVEQIYQNKKSEIHQGI